MGEIASLFLLIVSLILWDLFSLGKSVTDPNQDIQLLTHPPIWQTIALCSTCHLNVAVNLAARLKNEDARRLPEGNKSVLDCSSSIILESKMNRSFAGLRH